jgi:hypothetical protein
MHPARKLRIIGKSGDTRGYMLEVFDHDSGESISNIHHINLTLDVRKAITANVTYYMSDASGVLKTVYQDATPRPVEQTDTVEVVELDLTAIERLED